MLQGLACLLLLAGAGLVVGGWVTGRRGLVTAGAMVFSLGGLLAMAGAL